MARPRKTFPDYPEKPHRCGQAVIRVDGHDKYLGPFGSPESHQEYERLRTERYLASLGRQLPPAPPQHVITVAEMLVQFLAHAQTTYQRDGKPTQQFRRLRDTMKLLRLRWGPELAAAIDPPALDNLLTWMCESHPCGYCKGAGKRGKAKVPCKRCEATGQRKWSRLHIKHTTACIKQIWDWAAFRKLIPAHGLRVVRSVRRGTRGVRESAGVRSVPRATVQATVAQAGPVVRDMIEVQYLTGMRPEEVIGLQGRRIDTAGLLPAVGRFPGLWVYDVDDAWNKNAWRGHARVVFFGPKAQRLLKRYMKRDPAAYLFNPLEASQQWAEAAGRRWAERSSRGPGDHYSTASYGRAVKRACARAKVPHWTPLQLRHLRATEIRSQYSSDHARVVLGHHLAGVTGRYAEPDLEKAATVMREIG